MEAENVQQQVNQGNNLNQNPPPVNPTLNQKGNFLLIIGIIVLFLVIGAGGYFLYQKQVNKPVTIPQTSQLTPSPIPDETANWKAYTNTTWNYQFQYPSTWIMEELDIEHIVVTSPDIEKTTDGRIVKFPANYIRVNIVDRENITRSFEEEIKSVYTESPQCSVGSECSSSPPLITKKTNANSIEYYSLTTGVYNNELAIFSLPKDKNRYVLIDPRIALASNIKLPDKMLSNFKFTDQKQTEACKPETKENVGKCALGKIEVYTNRSVSKEKLQQFLNKFSLTVLQNMSFGKVMLDVRKLDKKFTSGQWQEDLRDIIVANVTITDTGYTDGTYSNGDITFIQDVTDQQINDYIQKKGIEKSVYQKLGIDNRYIVKVPGDTEFDWREKLMNESKDITGVRQIYINIAIPL